MTAATSTDTIPHLQRGDVVELDLHAWGRLGEAMARHAGVDIFVFGGIPGERVEAEIVAIRRKYVAAQVTRVIRPSPARVEPPCQYFGQCTGCQWQHVDYAEQLVVKTEIVRDALERIGNFHAPVVQPALASPRRFHYRNHARFNIWRENGALGFTHRERRRFVQIDRCLLMHDGINDILAQLQGHAAETSQLSIRSSPHTGDYLVQPTLKNPEIEITTGQKTYRESVADQEFRVSSPSFFQVNVWQAARLAELVRDALELTGGETVVDAYAGVGTFAVLLSPYAWPYRRGGRVNRRYRRRHCERCQPSQRAAGNRQGGRHSPRLDVTPDAVILDPSRSGCQPPVLETLLALRPSRIAYVSCNPESLARDLRTLSRGYRIQSVQPVDMFPQTHHVECVATLVAKPETAEIVLASASPRRRELLSGLGIDFRVAPAGIPEEQEPDETPEQMVRRLSREKALAVAEAESSQSGYYVAADSTVVLDGESIAKPSDAEEARSMLRRLRGTIHQVITGYTVYDAATGRCITASNAADVQMRDFHRRRNGRIHRQRHPHGQSRRLRHSGSGLQTRLPAFRLLLQRDGSARVPDHRHPGRNGMPAAGSRVHDGARRMHHFLRLAPGHPLNPSDTAT